MTEKPLKKKSRLELLELLLDAEEENERLKEENRQLKEQLESRRIVCKESGSLAQAALKLAGVFEAADEAVRIYTESLKGNADDPALEQ